MSWSPVMNAVDFSLPLRTGWLLGAVLPRLLMETGVTKPLASATAVAQAESV